MAAEKSGNAAYDALMRQLKAGTPGNCYVLHGDERYLLDRRVKEIRRAILSDSGNAFDIKHFSGIPDPDELYEAVSVFPLFGERTLVEVTDYDFARDLDTLLPVLRDLPEHVCLLFICAAGAFKADKRLASVKELYKIASVVEFTPRAGRELAPWIREQFKAAGRSISVSDAEYLAFATGGLMSSIVSETQKLAAHCEGDTVTRADIDALVDAVPDAIAYRLTDAIISRDFKRAARELVAQIATRDPGQLTIHSITTKMRQLLLARLYLDEGRSAQDLMAAAGMKTNVEFQAKALMTAAKKLTVAQCRTAVRLCCDSAFRLNNGGGSEVLTELLTRLSANVIS